MAAGLIWRELSILATDNASTAGLQVRKSSKKKLALWKKRNQKCLTIRWRFTTKDARIKLSQLYPKFCS